MHQALLFLSRFSVGLWIVLVGAFLSLLLSNAPNVPNTAPFASRNFSKSAGSPRAIAWSLGRAVYLSQT